MRPILIPKQAAEALLRNMRKRFSDAIDEAKADALEIAEDLSPKRTGTFSRSFEWRGNRLVNTADHAKFADNGFTRRGRGTAMSFRESGGVRYSDRIAVAFAETLRRRLNRGR